MVFAIFHLTSFFGKPDVEVVIVSCAFVIKAEDNKSRQIVIFFMLFNFRGFQCFNKYIKKDQFLPFSFGYKLGRESLCQYSLVLISIIVSGPLKAAPVSIFQTFAICIGMVFPMRV